MRNFICFLTLFFSFHTTFPALAEEIRGELWTGSVYSSTFTAGVCVDSNNAVRGVLILQLRNGQKDTYHFNGNKNLQEVFHVRHNDGHTFSGKIDNENSVSGTLKTSKGFKITLHGKRKQNVILGPHCRPLNP